MRTASLVAWIASAIALAGLNVGLGCKCREDDAKEEEEERNSSRDHYWRADLKIVGAGAVRTNTPGIDCTSDGTLRRGACGPLLMRFTERNPAMMEATPAPGWRLDHWESRTREPDGSVVGRRGPMPDGARYVNGFGYTDTGESETVTAVFVASGDAAR
jgi:hypothetical protein